jgi:hypothetical protein
VSPSHSSQAITHPEADDTDATHIFDGLDGFATHIAHMRLGAFVTQPLAWPPAREDGKPATTLYHTALQWLSDDRDHRRGLENEGRKKRGARRDNVSLSEPLLEAFQLTFSLGADRL